MVWTHSTLSRQKFSWNAALEPLLFVLPQVKRITVRVKYFLLGCGLHLSRGTSAVLQVLVSSNGEGMNNNNTDFDVIIVGGGTNGLSAGCYLGLEGKKVLV